MAGHFPKALTSPFSSSDSAISTRFKSHQLIVESSNYLAKSLRRNAVRGTPQCSILESGHAAGHGLGMRALEMDGESLTLRSGAHMEEFSVARASPPHDDSAARDWRSFC
ncbi:MAG TPA: hypothetical protein VF524_13960 [Polyangia bacterium]